MNFFFSPLGCAKMFLSQTQDMDSRKHLLDFFPMALIGSCTLLEEFKNATITGHQGNHMIIVTPSFLKFLRFEERFRKAWTLPE